MAKAVTLVLMSSSKPLSFSELKAAVEERGKGKVDHDLILEELLVEMKKRKTITFQLTSNGNLTGIELK